MNFFESQEAARRKTRHLVALFVLAVAGIILSVWLAVGLAGAAAAAKLETALPWNPWSGESLLGVAAVTLVVVATGSLYKVAALRGGGPVVARLLGARPVDPGTRDLKERRLLNVVEELSIAAGMAVPSVYVMDAEEGINAFAAGFTPSDTVVAVTQGTLDYLSRDELQGVIGHELSHALNGDSRIKLRLIGVLHGILVIAIVGRVMARAMGETGGGRSRSRDGKGDPRIFVLVLGLALMAIGWIGVFFGRLIKAAVSRQRELLADAAAVQFTRNPAGLAGALKKIGGLGAGSRVDNAHAEEASHLFFSQAVSALGSLLATHPPLSARISRLEPGWDGAFVTVREDQARAAVEAGLAEPARAVAGRDFVRQVATVMAGAGVAGTAGRLAAPPAGPAPAPAPPAAPTPSPGPPPPPADAGAQARAVVESAGTLDAARIAYAERLLAALPSRLGEAVREPMGAEAAVFALLLDRDDAMRQRQLEELARSVPLVLYAETVRLSGPVDAVALEARLPLLDLALPALRRLSAPQYRAFRSAVQGLVAADARLSLFEFTLHRVLLRHLDVHFQKTPPAPAVHGDATAVARPAAVLLSALAWAGQPGGPAAAAAFEDARRALGARGAPPPLRPAQECGLDAVGQALEELGRSTPALKGRLLEACVRAVAHDRRVTVKEGELLRAIADGLDCPLPPFLPGQSL